MILNKRYKMSATYWAKTGSGGYGGGVFATPVVLTVHWEDKNELFYNQVGDEKVSRSIVFLQVDVTVGGYLYLGTTTETDPKSIEGAYEIKAFNKIPDIRAEQFERKALL